MTRTRSEARRRAAHGPQDHDAQAGITIDAPDPPPSDSHVTHGSSARSADGMPTKRHTNESPLAQDIAQQSSPAFSLFVFSSALVLIHQGLGLCQVQSLPRMRLRRPGLPLRPAIVASIW